MSIERAMKIEGWMTERELQWLASKAASRPSHAVIVEVGSNRGRSTRALGDHALGVVHAVDPWPDECKDRRPYGGQYEAFLANLSDLIQSGKVVPHRTEFKRGLFAPASVDMVFIDGDHSYEAVSHDIQVALEILKPGGLLSGHDYHEVQRAVLEHVGIPELTDTIWEIP